MAAHPIGVHVGPGLTQDGGMDGGGPLTRAAEMDADGVQFFLGDPQGWKAPKLSPEEQALLAGDTALFVHAPYVLNVASTNNRIRIPSRKTLTQHAQLAAAVGARGMVVHGGHVLGTDDPAAGVDNWRKTFARQAEDGGFPLPLLIENTAGGGNAMARDLDALARLWEAVGGFGAGFVLDTCHAWAAGWDLATAVDDVRATTGRIDLVHLNNSRDPRGSSRDRHAPLADGEIPVELLLEVARAADAPVVLETPGDAADHAGEVALLRSALS
ncbi:deoxyribonuclease IV [Geodermatophilus sp. DSM 44513]|uniref:deoxyribonuclease IV n=1 Tax=Geodermatophilus sp. DSM 44513 TaxID=1528104 RepID=UPI00127A8192|nr:deoxyribonuclease IV [Geodermatophilus sp. DSM 44513]WNV75651.1 deoxyribonuclease IV [Geodermatophilus sp. DSM 44513]